MFSTSKENPYSDKGDHKIHDGKCTFSKGIHLENYITKDAGLAAEGEYCYITVYPGLNNNCRIYNSNGPYDVNGGANTPLDTSPYNSTAEDYSHRNISWWDEIQTFQTIPHVLAGVNNLVVTSNGELCQWRLVSSATRVWAENASAKTEGYWEAICHELPNEPVMYNFNKKIKQFVPWDIEFANFLNNINWTQHCSYRTGHMKDLHKQTWNLPVHNHDHDFRHIGKGYIWTRDPDTIVTLGAQEQSDNFDHVIDSMFDKQFHCWSIRFKQPYNCVGGGGLSFAQHRDANQQYYDSIADARVNPGNYTWTGSAANPPTAVPPGTWEETLQLAAESHLQDLLARNYFSHDSTNGGAQSASPEGTWHYDRAAYFGWGSTNGVVENIYSSSGPTQPTGAQVIQAWANSGDNAAPGTHSGNLIWGVADVYGVASAYDEDLDKWIVVALIGDMDAFGVDPNPNSTMEELTGGEEVTCTPLPLKIHSVHNIEVLYNALNTAGRAREYASAQLNDVNTIDNPALDRKRKADNEEFDNHHHEILDHDRDQRDRDDAENFVPAPKEVTPSPNQRQLTKKIKNSVVREIKQNIKGFVDKEIKSVISDIKGGETTLPELAAKYNPYSVGAKFVTYEAKRALDFAGKHAGKAAQKRLDAFTKRQGKRLDKQAQRALDFGKKQAAKAGAKVAQLPTYLNNRKNRGRFKFEGDVFYDV